MALIRVLFLSVFAPRKISKETLEKQLIRSGWIFILIRWAYYSMVFTLFRDYQNAWTPFFKPPFGLSLNTYATLQKSLSIFFGFLLMTMISYGLFLIFRLRERISIQLLKILNILGVAYFIPFVILQPLDVLTINILGWSRFIIIPLHTIVLVWESIIAVILIDKIYPIKLREKITGIIFQVITWILLCALFWR